MKKIQLTKREEDLMDFLWDYGKPATSLDVLEHCKNITWSPNYTLLKKGAIEMCGMIQYATQYARQFRCVISREEYFLQQAQKSGMDSKELLRTAAALAAHSDAKEREELVEELEHLIVELKGSEEK